MLGNLRKIICWGSPFLNQSKFGFSEQGGSLASTFKVRSKLAEFFKHTHPDILQNAPQKIKQQNLRSIKNLNSYIDSISQAKTIESKLLTFYVAQKSNNKSKKYFSFEVELPEVDSSMIADQNKSAQLMSTLVEVLNKKFYESRAIGNPSLRKQLEKQKQAAQKMETGKTEAEKAFETESQRFDRLQQQLKPYSKSRQDQRRQAMQKALAKKLNEAYAQVEKDALKNKLSQNVFFANTPTNKPMMWSRIAMRNAGIYRDYQHIFDSLLDPRLIYFDESLTIQQTDKFFEKLLPGDPQKLGEHADWKKLTDVFGDMELSQPPIPMYVTTKYRGDQIPGFFSVPYDFQIKALVSKFKQFRDTIVEQRQNYERIHEMYEDLKKELLSKNKVQVQLQAFRGIKDLSEAVIFLKRVSRYSFPRQTVLVPFQKEDYEIMCGEYKLDKSISCHVIRENRIVVRLDFVEEHLQCLVAETQQPVPA